MNETTESAGSKLNWPVVLIALSLIFVLGRDLYITNRQKAELKRISMEMEEGVKRSRLVGQNFEKMMRDLLQLAQTDAEAKTIVTKYGITINPPSTAPATTRSK